MHLVGHSYGSQACLAVATRRAVPIASLCVIEPTSINLLRRAGELALYEQMLTFRDSYFQAFERGDREGNERYGEALWPALLALFPRLL